jgi:hypothetical protein
MSERKEGKQNTTGNMLTKKVFYQLCVIFHRLCDANKNYSIIH